MDSPSSFSSVAASWPSSHLPVTKQSLIEFSIWGANVEWRQFRCAFEINLAWSSIEVCDRLLHLLQVLLVAAVGVEARAVQAVGLPAVLRAADPKEPAKLLTLLLGVIHLGNCVQEIIMSEHSWLNVMSLHMSEHLCLKRRFIIGTVAGSTDETKHLPTWTVHQLLQIGSRLLLPQKRLGCFLLQILLPPQSSCGRKQQPVDLLQHAAESDRELILLRRGEQDKKRCLRWSSESINTSNQDH